MGSYQVRLARLGSFRTKKKKNLLDVLCCREFIETEIPSCVIYGLGSSSVGCHREVVSREAPGLLVCNVRGVGLSVDWWRCVVDPTGFLPVIFTFLRKPADGVVLL